MNIGAIAGSVTLMEVQMYRISLVLAGAAILALTSCATEPPGASGAAAEAQLQQMLAGKMAVGQSSCVPEYQSSAGSLITPDAIAVSPNPGLVYVADTRGTGCAGMTGASLELVVNSHGPGGLCGGDQVEIRDVHTSAMVGSCLLHGFTQYRAR